ncbi:MAG: hypothetical protein GX275_13995 [Clostridiales bacterium]|nr:hypothetical protein [Clostridiales bacterium]
MLNSDENNIDINEIQDLLSQLQIFNISETVIYSLVAALGINIRYIHILKGQIYDKLNGTNYYSDLKNINILPLTSNRIFTIGTTIFLLINYNNFVKASNSDESESNKTDAFENYFATALILFATILSGSNINL